MYKGTATVMSMIKDGATSRGLSPFTGENKSCGGQFVTNIFELTNQRCLPRKEFTLRPVGSTLKIAGLSMKSIDFSHKIQI